VGLAPIVFLVINTVTNPKGDAKRYLPHTGVLISL